MSQEQISAVIILFAVAYRIDRDLERLRHPQLGQTDNRLCHFVEKSRDWRDPGFLSPDDDREPALWNHHGRRAAGVNRPADEHGLRFPQSFFQLARAIRIGAAEIDHRGCQPK